jgi:hypothetical protein
MQRLMIKLIIFTFPFFSLILFYIISDPFKIIYNYNEYYEDNKPYGVILNRDFVSVESFLQNEKKYQYNSFIFGNSRSMFYRAADWQKYIGDGGSVFHFDANSETLYGIYRKIFLIDSMRVPLRNALIVLDEETLWQAKNSEGHLFVKDYNLSGESRLSFQLLFFKDFITTPKFIFAYLDYKITGEFKPYMFADRMLSRIRLSYNPKCNEMGFNGLEDSILHHKDAYYSHKGDIFYERDTQEVYSRPVIKAEQSNELGVIRDILERNHTNYKIVINPLYDQKKISREDLAILQQYFGPRNVYDFSGINNITRDKTNYYENSHYRPHVAKDVLRVIYE